MEDIKPSSRISPYIRFKQEKKLHRQALVLEKVGHGFDNETLFDCGNMILNAGSRLAVIGENGTVKTTFLRCLLNELDVNQGTIQ